MQITSARNISSTGQILDGIVESADVKDDTLTADDIAANAIGASELADNAVDQAAIGDDAVGLPEMASGTDGTLITFDASGNPVAFGPGNAGEVPISQGAGAPPVFGPISASKLLAKANNVSVNTTTTETTLISATVPGGSLSTTNVIKFKLLVDDFGAESGNAATFRLKYGSTTLASCIVYGDTTSEDWKGVIEGQLVAGATTSAQRAALNCFFTKLANNSSTILESKGTGTGTATEDSTGDLTFSVTVQFQTSNVAYSIVVPTGTLELAIA